MHKDSKQTTGHQPPENGSHIKQCQQKYAGLAKLMHGVWKSKISGAANGETGQIRWHYEARKERSARNSLAKGGKEEVNTKMHFAAVLMSVLPTESPYKVPGSANRQLPRVGCTCPVMSCARQPWPPVGECANMNR